LNNFNAGDIIKVETFLSRPDSMFVYIGGPMSKKIKPWNIDILIKESLKFLQELNFIALSVGLKSGCNGSNHNSWTASNFQTDSGFHSFCYVSQIFVQGINKKERIIRGFVYQAIEWTKVLFRKTYCFHLHFTLQVAKNQNPRFG